MSTQAPVSLPGVPGPGELIAGKYRVEGLLGYGGMGAVVSAMHTQLGQRVAIKFLLPGVLGQREPIERFLREARAAVKIQSEHVAKVLDVGELEGGAPYMVMEFLDGRDLGAMLDERKSLPIDEAVGYVLEACEAIAEAHAVGIIHRDIKPSNLFLARRAGRGAVVKVLDFGISKVVQDDDGKLTTTNITMGSPHYMSPEQIKSAKNIDARSDVWSLGMVLYELIGGEPAFRAETIPALFVTIATEEPRPITELRPDIPAELAQVVMRCLAKDISRRHQSIAELAQALAPFAPPRSREYAERVTMAAARAPDTLRLSTVEAAEQSTMPALSGPGAPRPSGPVGERHDGGAARRRKGAVAGVVGAAVLALGALAMMRPGGGETARLVPEVPVAPKSAPSGLPSASASQEAAPKASAPVEPVAEPPSGSSPQPPASASAEPPRKGGVLPQAHASTQQPSKPPPGKGIRGMLDDRR